MTFQAVDKKVCWCSIHNCITKDRTGRALYHATSRLHLLINLRSRYFLGNLPCNYLTVHTP